MAVIPLRWQGASRIEQLRSLLDQRAREWLRGWAIGALDIDSAFASLPQSDRPQAGERWFLAKTMSGSLLLRLPPNAFERLGGLLADVTARDVVGLAAGLGRRALFDALQTLVPGSQQATELDVSPASHFLDRRCGIAAYEWTLGPLKFQAYLDAGLCDASSTRVSMQGSALTSRREALNGNQLTLTALLDLGPAALADTIALQPGEVIKCVAGLGTSIRAVTQQGSTVFSGELVADHGHRAVRCGNKTTGESK